MCNYIILYFGDQWDDSWRRRQQLALRLSQQSKIEKVIYVELPLPLTSLVKLILNKADIDGKRRWMRLFKRGLVFNYNDVLILTPLSILPIILKTIFFKANYIVWLVTTRFFIQRILKKYKGAKVLFWGSHPYANDFLKRFQESFICYDFTERFEELEEMHSDLRSFIQKKDMEISRCADIILTQTTVSYGEKKRLNPNVCIVPNAVDEKVFQKNTNLITEGIDKLKKPILGYIGSINSRLDYNLLDSLAKRFKQCSLVFIGLNTDNKLRNPLQRHANVFFMREKPHGFIQEYLALFDVCLIPFLITRLTETESPIKLYDYLVSGKPIVTTNIPGVSAFADIVYIAKTREEFFENIDMAINERDSMLSFKRIAVAKRNTWKNRTEEIMLILQNQAALALE